MSVHELGRDVRGLLECMEAAFDTDRTVVYAGTMQILGRKNTFVLAQNEEEASRKLFEGVLYTTDGLRPGELDIPLEAKFSGVDAETGLVLKTASIAKKEADLLDVPNIELLLTGYSSDKGNSYRGSWRVGSVAVEREKMKFPEGEYAIKFSEGRWELYKVTDEDLVLITDSFITPN